MNPQHVELSRIYDALLSRTGEANPRPRIEPVRRLAELVGAPQYSQPVIQVAGTNGKSSTSRAIESLLRSYGLRTGLFTSPHLVEFTERFQIDGVAVDDALFISAWQELQAPLEFLDAELASQGQGPITFFEAIAVLAYVIFADAPVDVAVIEVGMGGEWDATNIATPQVAVFTPIDLDHVGILGDTIEEIARTKSGIISEGAAVVVAAQKAEVTAELVAAAQEKHASLYLAERDYHVRTDLLAVGGRLLEVEGITAAEYEPFFLPLYGSHQSENAALAIAAVEAFFGGNTAIPQDILEEAFAQLSSPGRLQLIGNDPIVYVDAAHNPHGAEALARAVTESFNFSEMAVVVGMLADKDAAGVLRELAPIATKMFLTPVASSRTAEVFDLVDVVADELDDVPYVQTDDLAQALEEARVWAAEGNGRGVLVTGSVLLVGETIVHSRKAGWGTV